MPEFGAEAFKLPVFLLLLSVLYAVEALNPVRPWQTPHRSRLFFHAGFSIFNTVLTRLIVVGPFLAWVQFVWDQKWGFSHLLGLQGGMEVLVTFVVYDAYDYAWHRANHVIPFLWRFHKVHHIDTHVDVTTSLRFHPGELFLSYGVKAVWTVIWGPSLLGFTLCEIGITAYSQFHHSNLDFGDRWERCLRWVHMTPRLHASHHTLTPRTRNANYSTIFLIWDKLFGTFREVDFEAMKELGLPEGRHHDLSFLAMLKAPFERVRGEKL